MPDAANSHLKPFAARLLALEAAADKSRGSKGAPAFLVCEKLRAPLGNLMGIGGFRSLLTRALTLAFAEVPALTQLRVADDGSLTGLNDLKTNLDPITADHAEAALVSRLLELLVIFIGEALTLRLLRDIWPELDAGR